MLNIIKILFVAAMALVSSPIAAQQFSWSADFGTIFDNREGEDYLEPTKTAFQTILAPEIGVRIDDNHSVMGGAVWTQPIGTPWSEGRLTPTLYYRYSSPQWRFSFGMFPRTHLLRQQPDFLWSDSLKYNQRNIRGALVQYTAPDGFVEAFIDWRGVQSMTRREAFNINASGEWNQQGKILMLGGNAMLNHLAKTANRNIEQYIVDNLIINPYIGANLTRIAGIDSLAVRTGAIVEYLRYRLFGSWQLRPGYWLDIDAQWRWLGAKNTFYTGKALFTLYSIFGSQLDMGQPTYRANWVNRTKVFAYIMRNHFMNLKAELDFMTTDKSFAFSQKLLLRVYLDDRLFARKSNTAQKLINIY